jgi:hypothetical protein
MQDALLSSLPFSEKQDWLAEGFRKMKVTRNCKVKADINSLDTRGL